MLIVCFPSKGRSHKWPPTLQSHSSQIIHRYIKQKLHTEDVIRNARPQQHCDCIGGHAKTQNPVDPVDPEPKPNSSKGSGSGSRPRDHHRRDYDYYDDYYYHHHYYHYHYHTCHQTKSIGSTGSTGFNPVTWVNRDTEFNLVNRDSTCTGPPCRRTPQKSLGITGSGPIESTAHHRSGQLATAHHRSWHAKLVERNRNRPEHGFAFA